MKILLKEMYAVSVHQDDPEYPGTTSTWPTEKQALDHAQQIAIANNVDTVVYRMTPLANIRRAAQVIRLDTPPTIVNVTPALKALPAPTPVKTLDTIIGVGAIKKAGEIPKSLKKAGINPHLEITAKIQSKDAAKKLAPKTKLKKKK